MSILKVTMPNVGWALPTLQKNRNLYRFRGIVKLMKFLPNKILKDLIEESSNNQ